MALVKFGGGVTEIIGSVGGSTFKRTRGGSVIQAKSNPIQPRTSVAVNHRNKFAYISTNWRNITESEQLGWNELALEQPYQNAIGATQYLSGQQTFIKWNLNRLNFQTDFLAVAPSVQSDPFNEIDFFNASILNFTIDLQLSRAYPDQTTCILFLSPSLSPGIKYNSSKSLLCFEQLDWNTSSINLYDSFKRLYGEQMFLGNRIFLVMQPIDIETGQAFAPLKASCLVAD